MEPSRLFSVSCTGCARISAAAGFALGSRLRCSAFKEPAAHTAPFTRDVSLREYRSRSCVWGTPFQTRCFPETAYELSLGK